MVSLAVIIRGHRRNLYLVDPHITVIIRVTAVHQVVALVEVRSGNKYLLILAELGQLTDPLLGIAEVIYRI